MNIYLVKSTMIGFIMWFIPRYEIREEQNDQRNRKPADKQRLGVPFDPFVMCHPLSDILDNIEDLEPEFSQVITDNFWDLI